MRSKALSEETLPNSFTDELGYDVAKNEFWIAGLAGLKLSEFNDMVELAHDAMFCNYCKISFGKHRLDSAA